MNTFSSKLTAGIRRFLSDRLPTVIIVGLIALYYIQLSQMVQ